MQPNHLLRRARVFFALCVTLLAGAIFAPQALADLSRGTVTGQVFDANWVPLEGVTVAARGARSVHTNAGGMYKLTGVGLDSNVTVTFTKSGYAPTQGVVSFKKSYNERQCWVHYNHGRFEHNRGCNTTLRQVTLAKMMLKSGAAQTVSAAAGGTVVESGFKATFPANALTVQGDVDVVVTPIDVSTSQIAATPGDFSARTARGRSVKLESFSMADFTLTQRGRPVNLKRGATADIELLLPATTRLVAGDVKPMWYFDTASNLWIEEGTGTVGASTTTPGRLAVFATVKHFTYWNSDQPMDSTCVSGFVVDPSGNPLSGVSVEGFGVDYAGHSYAVPTDANGHYCIQVRSGSTTDLRAYMALGGSMVGTATAQVTSGMAQTTCATGGCETLPDIVLPNQLACVSGDVKDASGQPVPNLVVYSGQGSTTTTDANGTFQIPALANQSVAVFAYGYPMVTVTTGAAGDPCAVAHITPAGGGGATACITGFMYICGPTQPPAVGETISVVDNIGNLFGTGITNSNGQYCIEGLPPNTMLRIGTPEQEHTDINTGVGGGSCATNSCNAMPSFTGPC